MDHITSTQQWPKWSEQYNAGDITTADETGNDLPVGKKQNHVKGLSCVWLRQLIILRKKEKAAFAAWKKLFFFRKQTRWKTAAVVDLQTGGTKSVKARICSEHFVEGKVRVMKLLM